MDGTITAPFFDFVKIKDEAGIGDVDMLDYLATASGPEYKRVHAIMLKFEDAGVAEAKLPPMPMNTEARPSRIALIASTVSYPCLRGVTMPNWWSRAFKNVSGTCSQMPMVRSPCTLECPRTGHTPAPGLPICPP